MARQLSLARALAAAGLSLVSAQTEVDYVIVGGGTAGCALAARLCEGMPNAQVALLERGNPRSDEAEFVVRAMRQYFSPVTGNDEVTENFESEPNSGLSESRSVSILAGKTLGGSSAINGAQFSTPTTDVVEGWGIEGLDGGTATRLYNKVRTQLGVAQPPPELSSSYTPAYFQANTEQGVTVVDPPTIPVGADNDAVWVSYLAADPQGRRVDSATGYLGPVADTVCSDNLQIIQGATVSKVVIQGEVATGVEYIKDGQTLTISARAEVVMTAGPFHTPKLLQLSGVGPTEVLSQFGIPTLADLPVGEAAQARAYDQILASYPGVPVSLGGNQTAADSPAARAQFDAGNGGPLGFARSQINGVFGVPIGAWRALSFIPETGDGDPRVHQAGCLPNPTSRATVMLASLDPTDPPSVDTNIFGSNGEAEQMAACLNKEMQIITSMPANFQIKVTSFGPNIGADEVRASSGNGNHFVGACAVGTVLDPTLKVFGFQNLRVADASAIPDIPPNSGPAGSVYMLAEFLAEKIIAAGLPTGGGSAAPSPSEPADLVLPTLALTPTEAMAPSLVEALPVADTNDLVEALPVADTPDDTPDEASCSDTWEQCGGDLWEGPTCCQAGLSCIEFSQHYSQCLRPEHVPTAETPSSAPVPLPSVPPTMSENL